MNDELEHSANGPDHITSWTFGNIWNRQSKGMEYFTG